MKRRTPTRRWHSGDILTNLSRSGDFEGDLAYVRHVVPCDAVRNAREIGKALGVATLLEGASVGLASRRVNVQLIDATTTNIFGQRITIAI